MNMALVKRGLAVAVLFAGFSPVACGSDSGTGDTTKKVIPNDKKEDSGPPAPPPPPGSIPCGEKNCVVPTGSTGTACCIDHFNSTCGVNGGLGGGCVKPPPPQPTECPVLPPIGGVFMLRGCCTSTSICGVDTSMFPGGNGCTDYATFKAMAAMYMGGGMGGMGGGGGLGAMFMINLPADDPACTQPAAD